MLFEEGYYNRLFLNFLSLAGHFWQTGYLCPFLQTSLFSLVLPQNDACVYRLPMRAMCLSNLTLFDVMIRIIFVGVYNL